MALQLNPPPKVRPRLKHAPKIRQLLWCDFPADAHLPEFWKTRPVLVISKRTTLEGAVTVVPCSGLPQDDNYWACRLKVTIDGNPSWAICDKVTTLAVSRLAAERFIPRISQEEFVAVMRLVMEYLPVPPELDPRLNPQESSPKVT